MRRGGVNPSGVQQALGGASYEEKLAAQLGQLPLDFQRNAGRSTENDDLFHRSSDPVVCDVDAGFFVADCALSIIAFPSHVSKTRKTFWDLYTEQNSASLGMSFRTRPDSFARLWRGRAPRRFAAQFHPVTS